MSKTSEHKKLHLERALTQKTWNFMSVEGGSLTTIIMFGLTILCGSAFVLTHTAPLYSLLEAARRPGG